MIAKIRKWGNSLGLRIPKGIAEDARVAEGATVDLKVENGRLVIVPVKRSRYRLSDLLDRVTPENLHPEVPVGRAVGREAW